MPAYSIVDIALNSPEDAEPFEKYVEAATKLLKKIGVKTLVVDPEPVIIEGDWKPRTVVVHEFPDMATLQEFYSSEEYAPLRAKRLRLSNAKVIAVNGV